MTIWNRKAKDRRRIYGEWSFLAWGYGQPCAVEGCTTTDRRPGSLKVIEAAHTKVGGMSLKADHTSVVFLCWRHHQELHDRGRFTFEAAHQFEVGDVTCVTLADAAAETQRQFRLWCDGLAY